MEYRAGRVQAGRGQSVPGEAEVALPGPAHGALLRSARARPGAPRAGSVVSVCALHVPGAVPSTLSLGTQLLPLPCPGSRGDFCFSLIHLFVFRQRFSVFLVLPPNIWQ